MASLVFNSFWADVESGAINPEADTFKIMLVNGYTPNKATHAKRSDVTGEVTGTGYTAGGNIVAATRATDAVNNRQDLNFAATSWANSTVTATGAVIYKSRGGAATADELVMFIDFGQSFASTAGAFNVASSTARIQN